MAKPWRLLSLLLLGALSIAAPTIVPEDCSTDEFLPSYDYIIVGGGTAGLTLAHRLSTSLPSLKILVLEAAPRLTNSTTKETIDIPSRINLLPPEDLLWNFRSVAEPENGRNPHPIMFGFAPGGGGGSAVNGGIWQRAWGMGSWRGLLKSEEQEQWESEEEWGKWFRKAEEFTPVKKSIAREFGIEFDPKAHDLGVPKKEKRIQTGYNYLHSHLKWWRDALVETSPALGKISKKFKLDHATSSVGAFFLPNSFDVKTGTRSYSGRYFQSRKNCRNVRIAFGRRAVELLYASHTAGRPEVVGVQFQASADGPKESVYARKVILSAGAINTPKLLELSGIGDFTRLQELGITMRVNLPGVGENLQDHALVGLFHSYAQPLFPSKAALTANATYAAEMLELYQRTRTGPLTTGGGNMIGMLSANMYAGNLTALLDKFNTKTLTYTRPIEVERGYIAQLEILKQHYSNPRTSVLEFIEDLAIVASRPASRGSTHITSDTVTDPFTTQPEIKLGTFTHPLDHEFLSQAYTYYITRVLSAPSIAGKIIPPLEMFNPSPSEMEAFIKQWTIPSLAHTCCTASMMKPEFGGVVDSKFRIHFVDGLYVVDNSVLPMIGGEHTQVGVYMLAEKAADGFIREERRWK